LSFNFISIIFAKDMRKSGKKRVMVSSLEPKRHQRMVCLVSEEEALIVDNYLKKYKITNKGRWMRETLLSFIRRNMVEEDYPTLFNEHDMRR
jgi:predicted transcriptional regulator